MPSKRIFKKAAEFLTQPMFHGGTYVRGDEVTQPLYMSPSKRLASSYVDEYRNPGGRLVELKPQVSNPAPERLVNAAARKHVPDNEKYGYTPASAFDTNLHEYEFVQALIDELTKRGYDSAIAGDIGLGNGLTFGREQGNALVLFPGAKAYKDGGKVEAKDQKAAFGVFPQMKPKRRGKSDIGDKMIDTLFIPHDPLDLALMAMPYGKAGRAAAAGIMALSPMDAEAGKVSKTLQAMKDELLLKGLLKDQPVDLSRRLLFGLQPTQDMAGRELAKVERQAAKEGQAPTIVKSTTSVSPDAGKTSRVVEQLMQTPVSRRQVLQSAASQAVQGALPKGALPTPLSGVEDLVSQAVAPAAASADMIPGLIMTAIKQGIPENEIPQFVRSKLGSAQPSKLFDPNDRTQMELLYRNLTDPMGAPNDWEFFGPMRPSGALNVMLQTPGDVVPPMQMRGALRQIRDADPERYRQMINSAKDFSMSTGETAIESGMITPRNLERYLRGEHAEPKYRPEHLWSDY